MPEEREEKKWTPADEGFLTSLEKQCNSLQRHHTKEYTYYNKLSSKFNIPILILSALNSLCAIALNDFVAQKYVSILNAVISAGTGVLGSIQLYMKLNEKMTAAVRSQLLYKKLALKISKELNIDRSERDGSGTAFLNDCFSEFNTILEQANPLESKHPNFLELSSIEEPSTPSSLIKSRIASIESFKPYKSGGSSTPDEFP